MSSRVSTTDPQAAEISGRPSHDAHHVAVAVDGGIGLQTVIVARFGA